MKEKVKSFCNQNLYQVRMKYRTSSPLLPKNVLLHLFLLVAGLVDALLTDVSAGGFTWLLPEGRRYMAATLVSAIREKHTVDGVVAKKFIMKVEHLLAPFIDVLSVVSHFFEQVPLQFSFSIVENITSRSYLKKMIDEQPTLWTVLDKLIRGERNIKVTCNEPFLNYPSECAILTQLLLELVVHFDLTFKLVSCSLHKWDFHETTMKFRDEDMFSSFEAKKLLLQGMLGSLGTPVTIKESHSFQQQPYITLSNEHFELRIQTSRGIGYWWKAQHAFKTPTKVSLITDPMQDMDLENMAMKNSAIQGVHFTITYTPIDNIKALLSR